VSFSTILGFIAGVVIIIAAMAAGPSLMLFVDVPSMMIVIGGTIAATMIRFSLGEVGHAFAHSLQVIKSGDDEKDIKTLLEISKEALLLSRKKGMLALESYEVPNSFFKKGIQMLVDGYKPDMVTKAMQEEHELYMKRAETSAGVFSAIGDTAPAFGMIGTLVGLVQMLANLSDPDAIGPAMAIALLTTLYGAMISQLYALPMADKINATAEEDALVHEFLIDAVDIIAKGYNPSMMEDLLSPYLPGGKSEGEEGEKAG
jgi:chemotaxis protein MotA